MKDLPVQDELTVVEDTVQEFSPAESPITEAPSQEKSVEMVTVCDIQFRNNSKIYYFAPGNLEIAAGTDVIIETSRGLEYGQCVRGNHTLPIYETVSPLRNVVRIATAQDTAIDKTNREREKKAYQICLKKIEELGLDMQLVSAECAFDGSKILFFFTAEERVDFRELVKMLGYALHSRIELRQIGVRDKAKMVGGFGICGRPFCCGQFLKDFQPVSIKMAKTQNLSLNSSKISGTCGRLMCCLNYEQAAYEDLRRTSPKQDSFVDTPDGRGTIMDVNLLKQSVRVRLEKQPDTIVCHKNCDICVLRSGKAKKTDEPIPDDLAPISGKKQNKPTEKPAFSAYLDPSLQGKSKARSADPAETDDKKTRRRIKAQRLGDALGKEMLSEEHKLARQETAVPQPDMPNETSQKPGHAGGHRQNRRDSKHKPPLSDAELTEILSSKPETPKQSPSKNGAGKKDHPKAPKKESPKPQDTPKKESSAKESEQESAPAGNHKPRNHYHRYHKYRKHNNNNKSEG